MSPVPFTMIHALMHKLFGRGPAPRDQDEETMQPFEALVLANARSEPSKWFLDHTGADSDGQLRASNRERGVVIMVPHVGEGRRGFLHQAGAEDNATCGRVELSLRFTRAFRDWALAEYNTRLTDELAREKDRVSQAIQDAFK